MPVKMKSVTGLCMVMSAFIAQTSMAACYEVTGKVETTNVTPAMQVGTIKVKLVNQDTGQLYYKRRGKLVGYITEVGPNGLPADLSHVAIFRDGSYFVTSGDVVTVTGPISACSFGVDEQISNIIQSGGAFGDVEEVYITATGTVSYCPDDNQNRFTLDGEVCFADDESSREEDDD